MTEFSTLDAFPIAGRGMAHVVANRTERPEADIIRELVGADVLLDGVQRRVVGVESWLIPGAIIKAGAPIVILVKAAP